MSESIDAKKASTGIDVFDELTAGGLPRGRVTAVIGGPGSGKTLFALEALMRGARDFGEPGLFVAFEESAQDVLANAASFSWSGGAAGREGVAMLDAELASTVIAGGAYDLLGTLAMIGARAKKIGARRVVFDGLDVLLSHLGDQALARREIVRLREWLHASGLTGIVTVKAHGALSGDESFLPFLATCVVSLDVRVVEGTALRYLRVAKYRGAHHGANEVPFTITRDGIALAGVTRSELSHPAPTERVSTGVHRLDAMLGGGYLRGSSVLISGAPGTAKTSLAASFAAAACARGERVVYVSFDEAPAPILRNVTSVGLDLARHVEDGRLLVVGMRSMSASADAHLARVRQLLIDRRASHLVVDPISALTRNAGRAVAEHAALALLDFAKERAITVLCTTLLANAASLSEETPLSVSAIADTWMHVSYMSQGGERNRALTIVKSRGTEHSSQVRELTLSREGVSLADVYAVGGEVLMGTLRWEREMDERRARAAAEREFALREKGAELALAEARARGGAVATEQALREAELERIRAERAAENGRIERLRAGVLARRGADTATEPGE